MDLTDEPWGLIERLLPARKLKREDRSGRTPTPSRALWDGILWILRTGAQWSGLPREKYPPYKTVHRWLQGWVSNLLRLPQRVQAGAEVAGARLLAHGPGEDVAGGVVELPGGEAFGDVVLGEAEQARYAPLALPVEAVAVGRVVVVPLGCPRRASWTRWALAGATAPRARAPPGASARGARERRTGRTRRGRRPGRGHSSC
ncbi:transposase [Myxococcus virescens]|uniref:transposase n=1 Tax=Myxococcus virescens TaxID=83456 RepID=UPI003DA411B2